MKLNEPKEPEFDDDFDEVPANILKAWKKILKDNPEGQSIVLVIGNGNGITIKTNMCPQSTFNFLTLANDIWYDEAPGKNLDPSRN